MDKSFQRVIATLVFPETVPWAKMMIKSLRKHCDLPLAVFCIGDNIPYLDENFRVTLSLDALWQSLPYDRVNRGVNDKAKSLIFRLLSPHRLCEGATTTTEEVLYIDADCLILGPIDGAFNKPGDILMAYEKLDFYEVYLSALGCENPKITLNGGIILFRKDFSDEWDQWYHTLFSIYKGEHIEGQTVWNLVWHKANYSDILYQQYNQLHVKHGPHGAAIYHMAGLSNNMKTDVMKNLYQYFFDEEPPI